MERGEAAAGAADGAEAMYVAQTLKPHSAVVDLRMPGSSGLDVVRDLVGDDGRELADRYAWAADVRAALQQLPAAQREALEMAYFEDRTQHDIAARLDVPIGTVKSRLARGGRALASLLAPTRSEVMTWDDGTTRTRGGEVE